MPSRCHPASDAGARSSNPRGPEIRPPTFVLIATVLGSSLSFIDGSVMNVGLPAISNALQGSASGLQCVINAYLLPLSALVLFGGALGDRFGRGRVFVAGIVLFAAASIACALAPSLEWLIAGRAIQGVAAALLTPNSLAILNNSFKETKTENSKNITTHLYPNFKQTLCILNMF